MIEGRGEEENISNRINSKLLPRNSFCNGIQIGSGTEDIECMSLPLCSMHSRIGIPQIHVPRGWTIGSLQSMRFNICSSSLPICTDYGVTSMNAAWIGLRSVDGKLQNNGQYTSSHAAQLNFDKSIKACERIR